MTERPTTKGLLSPGLELILLDILFKIGRDHNPKLFFTYTVGHACHLDFGDAESIKALKSGFTMEAQLRQIAAQIKGDRIIEDKPAPDPGPDWTGVAFVFEASARMPDAFGRLGEPRNIRAAYVWEHSRRPAFPVCVGILLDDEYRPLPGARLLPLPAIQLDAASAPVTRHVQTIYEAVGEGFDVARAEHRQES